MNIFKAIVGFFESAATAATAVVDTVKYSHKHKHWGPIEEAEETMEEAEYYGEKYGWDEEKKNRYIDYFLFNEGVNPLLEEESRGA